MECALLMLSITCRSLELHDNVNSEVYSLDLLAPSPPNAAKGEPVPERCRAKIRLAGGGGGGGFSTLYRVVKCGRQGSGHSEIE